MNYTKLARVLNVTSGDYSDYRNYRTREEVARNEWAKLSRVQRARKLPLYAGRTLMYGTDGFPRFGFILGAVLVAIVAFSVVAILLGTSYGAHLGANYCAQYRTQWHIATHFVRYSQWSWQCLAHVHSHWLPTSQIRTVIVTH